jgi:thiol peroxidase
MKAETQKVSHGVKHDKEEQDEERSKAMDRVGVITMRGKPLTLVGTDVNTGDRAPGFTLLDGNLAEVKLEDFRGKIKVISVTPSLDTPVCDLQLRRFNHEATSLPHDIEVLNISMDLPFAISRFCTAAGIERARALSDYRDASFGNAYGVLIKELRLLARSIFIVDKDDVVRYREIVPEQSNHPDYDKALAELHRLFKPAKAA